MSKTRRSSLPDLTTATAAELQQWARSVKEAVSVLTGDSARTFEAKLDAAVTYRDLIEQGFAIKGTSIGSPVIPTTPPGTGTGGGGTAPPVDPIVPGAPTGLTATGAFGVIILEWDAAAYVGHAYTEIWRATTDDLGAATVVGITTGSIYSDWVGDNTTYYYWIRFVSTTDTKGPFNGLAGTSAQAALDPNYLLAVLDGQLTESHLYASLNARLDQIDDPDTGLIVRVSNMETEFEAALAWNFDASKESWTATDATLQYRGEIKSIRLIGLPTLVNQAVVSPSGLSIDGSKYTVIRARIRRNQGSGWTGSAFFATAGHGFSSSYYKQITTDPTAIGEWRVVEWRMDSLTAGGDNWTTSTITQLRLNLGATDTDVFDIDFVTVGRYAPQAYGAIIQQEASIRALADNNLANTDAGLLAQYTVKVDVNGYVSGYGLATTVKDAAPFSEFIIIADRFAIAPVASNPAAADGSPFYYITSPTVINGVTVPAGAYLKRAFIAEATIGTAQIENAAITAAKIADASIVNAKIGNLAVDTAKVADAAITTAKIANLAVTSAQIADATIGGIKIADGAIGGVKIADGAITADKLAADSVTADKIDVNSLSAVSATIGTLRTNATGPRVEIKDNLIEVYDANRLRVKIGVW